MLSPQEETKNKVPDVYGEKVNYLIVIPARGGSKGLPLKNICSFGGKPLILWTLEAALGSGIRDIIVSSDSQDIMGVLFKYREDNQVKFFHILRRRDELATDTTPLAPVIINAMEGLSGDFDAVITLQPTSPLRNSDDVINAINRFEKSKADSLLSVSEDYHSIWERKPTGEIGQIKARFLNRQQEAPLFIANGAIFITSTPLLLEKKQRIGGKVEIYVMPPERSIDVHTKEDIELAEFYLKRGAN